MLRCTPDQVPASRRIGGQDRHSGPGPETGSGRVRAAHRSGVRIELSQGTGAGSDASGRPRDEGMELDRIDIAILEHLQNHGRATTIELSEAVALSPSPCHRRQKLLEEAGVIQRYVALLDQEKVGLPVNAFVSVKLATHSDEALVAFERAIGACPEVMEMYEMTGARDYLMRVVAADLATFETFLRQVVMRIPGVQSVESAMALKRVVYHTNLPVRRGK
jgi:Lrp/AsnC family transcriptional regulator, leucine-responsive regulatory protein